MNTQPHIFFIWAATLGLFSLVFTCCQPNQPSQTQEPMAVKPSDTTATAANIFVDSLQKVAESDPMVQKAKCAQIEKSPFKNMGCCAELCPTLQLKSPDCCCEAVFEAYEKQYVENLKKPNSLKLNAQMKVDFILVRCAKKYKLRFDSIGARHKVAPSKKFDPND